MAMDEVALPWTTKNPQSLSWCGFSGFRWTPLDFQLAERVGFEPTVRGYRTPDFESGTFDHSATSPVSVFLAGCSHPAGTLPAALGAVVVWQTSGPSPCEKTKTATISEKIPPRASLAPESRPRQRRPACPRPGWGLAGL